MTEEERTALNEMTAIQGESRTVIGDGQQHVPLRHISVEALGVLELIGHPMAQAMHAAMQGHEAPQVEMGMVHVMELAWVLGEDEDVVLETALSCSPAAHRAATEAAMKYSRKFKDIRGWMDSVVGAAGLDAHKVSAAQFEAKSTLPAEKKMM